MNSAATNREAEFYIGYLPKAPAALAKTVVRTVVSIIVLAAAIALVLVFAQAPFAPSWFEFLQSRDFEGVYSNSPYPSLVVSRPGAIGSFSRYLLAAPGKHGFEPETELEASMVRLTGSLIYRGADTMIEVAPGSVRTISKSSGTPKIPLTDLGRTALYGEIVDTKCYMGVMNPGNGKVHRDCAVRCISGGLPPGFMVHEADGRASVLILSGSDGRPLNKEVLDFVAQPLRIEGQLYRLGDTLILRAEPATFYRTK